VPTSVHCDHLIQARVEGASDLRESLAENGECTTSCVPLLPSMRGLLGARRRDHPSGRVGELRISRRAHDWHRFPYPMPRGRALRRRGSVAADAVEVMAGLPPWEVLFPQFIGVYLRRAERLDSAENVILKLAGELTVSRRHQCHHRVLWTRRALISATGKATIPIWALSLVPTTSMFPYDQPWQHTSRHCSRRAGELADKFSHFLMADKEIEAIQQAILIVSWRSICPS